jgi:hypothetical protein
LFYRFGPGEPELLPLTCAVFSLISSCCCGQMKG